jgi:hypothetical protein
MDAASPRWGLDTASQTSKATGILAFPARPEGDQTLRTASAPCRRALLASRPWFLFRARRAPARSHPAVADRDAIEWLAMDPFAARFRSGPERRHNPKAAVNSGDRKIRRDRGVTGTSVTGHRNNRDARKSRLLIGKRGSRRAR